VCETPAWTCFISLFAFFENENSEGKLHTVRNTLEGRKFKRKKRKICRFAKTFIEEKRRNLEIKIYQGKPENVFLMDHQKAHGEDVNG
jgi:hypothetical protein